MQHDEQMILIDTNKYLAFYQTERISKLMPVLKKLRSSIFVTQQIVDEVERNKFGCVRKAIDDGLKMPPWTIPSPLLAENDPSGEIAKEFAEFKNKAEALKRKLEAEFTKLSRSVAESRDHISSSLKAFFGEPTKPTPDQLARAKNRKETGNPPGKKEDPLGDQLTWEQFLDASAGSGTLWIVSADEDFYVSPDKSTTFLNPILQRDLEEKKPRLAVHCFRTLTEALDEFVTINNVQESLLPDSQVLEELKCVEESLPVASTSTTSTTTAPLDYRWQVPTPNSCMKCGGQDTFGFGAYLRSQYGGLTLQYRCSKCGFVIDTGEDFD